MNGSGRSYLMPNGRVFKGNSRSEKRAINILGLTNGPSNRVRKCRSLELEKVQKYLDGTQYDHLAEWRECQDEEYVKVRDRKPRIIFPFAKILQNRVASKLVGGSTFPRMAVEDDPDTEQFLAVISSATFFRAKMLSAAKYVVSFTSAFVRFKFVEGNLNLETYHPNYCYPVFDSAGNLLEMTVKYVYETDEIDSAGKRIMKWFKLYLSKTSDILYDNPEYKPELEPTFTVVEQADHGLGMVQGEWFRWGDNVNGVDGEDEPITSAIDGFIDSINYNLSQSDAAASYGMEPQLTLKGIDEEEMNNLVKSSSRSWMLGREGEANFLEVSGSGIESAKVNREDLMKMASNSAQIVFLDPEKMVASAQSGKAMEVMHGPMVEMINEIRPWMAKGMTSLLQKILVAVVYYNIEGFQTEFVMPAGWQPQSIDIKAMWPPIFPLTIQDTQQLTAIAIQASNANIIARMTALKWLQTQGVDFGVEDFEAEQAMIDGQKQFGGFF